jgi:radical SAM protein with 4Fe4S-binding SPASM domain
MLSGVKKRKHKQFPLINLRTTITPMNAGSLVEMIHMAESVGADYCTFQVLNNTSRLGGVDLVDDLECSRQLAAIPPFSINTLADQLRKVRNASSRIRVRILPNLPDSSLLRHYENRLQAQNFSCVSPWTVLYVSPFGEVYPCLNYRVGSLREQPLRKVWNCLRYRQFRLRLLRQGLFEDCCGCCDLLPRHSLRRF